MLSGRTSHERPQAKGKLGDPKIKKTAGPESRNRLTDDVDSTIVADNIHSATASSSSGPAPHDAHTSSSSAVAPQGTTQEKERTPSEVAPQGTTQEETQPRAVASQEEIEAPGSGDELQNFEADPQDTTAVRERQQRSGKRDVAITAGDGAKEDWKHFDISKAMTALRHPDKAVRTRVLQRLHVRWYPKRT